MWKAFLNRQKNSLRNSFNSLAKTKRVICYFEARSLYFQAHFAEFLAEFNKIKYSVIGVTEAQRRGSGRFNLRNDAVPLYAGLHHLKRRAQRHGCERSE